MNRWTCERCGRQGAAMLTIYQREDGTLCHECCDALDEIGQTYMQEQEENL